MTIRVIVSVVKRQHYLLTLELYGEDAELAEICISVLGQPPKPLGSLILEVESHSNAVPRLHFCRLRESVHT